MSAQLTTDLFRQRKSLGFHCIVTAVSVRISFPSLFAAYSISAQHIFATISEEKLEACALVPESPDSLITVGRLQLPTALCIRVQEGYWVGSRASGRKHIFIT